MGDALWEPLARAQAAAVREGDVTAAELVESHLTRIAEVNPAVSPAANAVTQPLAERARAEVAEADRRRVAGADPGPLAGAPFTSRTAPPSRVRRRPSAPGASVTSWRIATRPRWRSCERPAARGPVELPEYLRLTGERLGIQWDRAVFLDAYPLVLVPVFTDPSFLPGDESRDAESHRRVRTALRMCTATSFVGVPAVAVPTGVVNGLPYGVQLIRRSCWEVLCLDAAEEGERRLGVLPPIDPRP
ncbi:hypothetical protein GCM10010211_11030 [Streptomyces albospinus]|uniref:Amidase n=1 Tax=Streptomyces albospinus TaxID=285515 RepID=A0ABQ2UQC6_9ACTN|nr:hypothetical protein GCM10010211_11030 [Streptomyces albospinus]